MKDLKGRGAPGFTLIEVAIAMGLVALLSLAIAEIMVSAQKSENNTKADIDVTSAAMVAGLMMQNSTACSNTIPSAISGSPTFNNSLTLQQLQNVKIPLRQVLTKAGQPLYTNGQTLEPNLTVSAIYLTGITIVDSTTATARIEVDANKGAKSFLGSPIAQGLSAPFGITTTTSGTTSTITGCGGGAGCTDTIVNTGPSSGYIKYCSGAYLEWLSMNASFGGSGHPVSFSFPTHFPHAVFSVTAVDTYPRGDQTIAVVPTSTYGGNAYCNRGSCSLEIWAVGN